MAALTTLTRANPQHHEYLDMLRRWNASINLVATGDMERLESRHLADSLALIALIPAEARLVTDLGTGAGFPGLPIAIARPDLRVTLVDAKTKAIAFLKAVRRELGLSNVEVFHGRVDAYEPSPPPDLILSRAAFPPPRLLEIAAKILPPGAGNLLIMLNAGNTPPTHPGFEHVQHEPAQEDRSNHLYRRR